MKLANIKGLGAAKLAALAELGINDIRDLLYFFPRRYVDRSITDTSFLQAGSQVTIILTVVNQYVTHARKSRLIVKCRSQRGEPISLLFFRGVAYFRHQFQTDDVIIVSGKLDFFQGLQIVHPDFEKLDEKESSDLLHSGRIIPLYKGSETLKKNKLDSRAFRKFIHSALEGYDFGLADPLPVPIRKKYDLLDYKQSLHNIHFPENDELQKQAQKSLIFEELYLFNLLLYHRSLLRTRMPRQLHPLAFGQSSQYQSMLEKLPFTLTREQDQSIQEILNDTHAPGPGAWLLQGDVGSGKTLVALGIALHYMEAGIQVALLAPTEVLARQHYLNITEILGLIWHPQIELYLGKTRAKQKAQILDRIHSGESLLITGTHSLLEDPVSFARLGLVIIDEQHRFGVKQREQIRSKGKNPDLLAMSATPIPRTLCLTQFSDLKLVTLKEKPAGRQAIQTMWLGEDRRMGMYKSIRNHIAKGSQGFIVYPLISESEKLDLRAAQDAYEELQTSIFPDLKLALLHGKLKSDEKERIMREFQSGRIQLLVSTTVIEVGVDVPNATMMIIENAERFGISQLHQLRGRVGRGSAQSFCVLMSDAQTPEASERLNALVESQDGFYLSEVDMKIRGPGELLGLRQHGLPGFRLADLDRDKKLVELSYGAVREFSDPGPQAVEMIRRNFPEGNDIFPDT